MHAQCVYLPHSRTLPVYNICMRTHIRVCIPPCEVCACTCVYTILSPIVCIYVFIHDTHILLVYLIANVYTIYALLYTPHIGMEQARPCPARQPTNHRSHQLIYQSQRSYRLYSCYSCRRRCR